MFTSRSLASAACLWRLRLLHLLAPVALLALRVPKRSKLVFAAMTIPVLPLVVSIVHF